MVSPFLPDVEKLAAVRDALPATGAGIYLNAPLAGPLPAESARAMTDDAAMELRVGRAHPDAAADSASRIDEARAAAAAILTTDVDRIVLAPDASLALAVLVTAIDWRPTDRLVLTEAGHAPPADGLADLVAGRGVESVVLDPDGPAPEFAAAFAAALDAGGRVAVVPHVSVATGAILPIAELAAIARSHGARLLVDGSQAAGSIGVDVDGLMAAGIDAYVVAGDRWLLGPAGIAVAAVTPGFEAAAGPAIRALRSAPPARGAVVGFARSCGWLSMYVGLGWALARAAAVTDRAARALAATPGVRLLAQPDRIGTIVSLALDGWPADQVLDELGGRIFAIASTVPDRGAVRLGFGWWTSEDEIGRIVRVVGQIAAHSPATLPPGARLTVLGPAD